MAATRSIKPKVKILIAIACLALVVILAGPPVIIHSGKHQIYTKVKDVEETQVGIVFGAGVLPNGKPTDMLRDRLDTAAELYENEKVQKIVVSGDNRVSHYNEPQAMYNYLIENDIPEEDIVRDYAGRRTYDTCYRAHEIFGIEKAILISQGYHLPRAIYLCQNFGVESAGLSATRHSYPGETWFKTREIIALYRSILDIYIIKPVPVLGEEIEI